MALLKILNEEDLLRIHKSSLRVLEEVGVKYVNKDALDIFKKAGLKIKDENIVLFSKDIIEYALSRAPAKIIRKGLAPGHDVTLGDGSLAMGGGSLPLYVVHPDTYERCQATLQDLIKFTRLVDALPNLVIGNGVVKPHDVPESIMHAVWNYNAVANMAKPSCCWYATTARMAQDTIEILSAACGGIDELRKRKTWTITICPDNSLIWGNSVIGLLEMAKVEAPIEILPMPFCGSMYPVTIAGALVQANAETLSAVVLAQLVNPGAPVIYAPSYGGIMDMKFGSHAFGTPETALYGAAAAQLGKWYNLPVNIMMGTTDSKVPDAQASYEKMMTMILPALAGVDCMSLVGGMLDFALSASYEQMVIDNEIAGQVLRLVKGFKVDNESLAVEIIKETRHGGNYLRHEHTLKHFREELWIPALADRSNRTTWELNGAKDIKKRAKEKVEEILSSHKTHGMNEKARNDAGKVLQKICLREKVDLPACLG